MKTKILTRTIWILSLVSLFTDIASEMLYPVMPIYLKTIGFSVILIGILEGLAEATAGLSKGFFGQLSDKKQKRAPFVQIGYSFSAISKPLMAAFVFPLWIFFVRTLDRLGKGVRTAARDAILSDETTPQNKGKVFGFHRSLDTLGAAIGPSLALLFLFFHPEQYRQMFIWAIIPGVLAIALSFLVKDKHKEQAEQSVTKQKVTFLSFLNYWKQSPAAYRQVVVGLLVFALFNSSDVFLLLKGKDVGLSDMQVIGVYIFYNVVYALMSYPLGAIADKIGLKKVFILGLFIFAGVYFGMSFKFTLPIYFGLFFLYGIYAAATEGISKALITNIVDKSNTATAIGTYTAFQSICTLLASTITGIVWKFLGAQTAFILTSTVTVAVAIYLIFMVKVKAIQQ